MLFLLAGLFTLIVFSHEVEAGHQFQDVPNDYRFASSIHKLVELNLFDAKDYYYPYRSATRGEMAEMLARSKGGIQKPGKTKFKDVPANYERSGYIQYAVDRGFISGYPDGTFRPNDPVTRGDAAILLSKRYYGLIHSYERYDVRFKDMTKSMKSNRAVAAMAHLGIINGYADHTYRPNEHITRGQLAHILNRAENENFMNQRLVVGHVQGDSFTVDEYPPAGYYFFVNYKEHQLVRFNITDADGTLHKVVLRSVLDPFFIRLEEGQRVDMLENTIILYPAEYYYELDKNTFSPYDPFKWPPKQHEWSLEYVKQQVKENPIY